MDYFYYLCTMDEIKETAQELFNYLVENIPPVFVDLGDLDPINDYDDIIRGGYLSNQDRRWLNLWINLYDELTDIIEFG